MTGNQPHVCRPGALRSLLSLPPESVIDRFLPPKSGAGPAEPVAGVPAPSDKTRHAPCSTQREHTIVLLPDADRPVAQYRLDDPLGALTRTKEILFLTRYKNFARDKSIVSASCRVRVQATEPLRRVSVAQRVLRSQGAARRKTLCGSCNSSLFQSAPHGHLARKDGQDTSRSDSACDPHRLRNVDASTDNRWTRVHPKQYNDFRDVRAPGMEWEEVSAQTSMYIYRRATRKASGASAMANHRDAGVRRTRDGKEVARSPPTERSLRPPPLQPLTPLADAAAGAARSRATHLAPPDCVDGHRVREPLQGATTSAPCSPSEVSELSAPVSCARNVDPPLAPLPAIVIPSFAMTDSATYDSYAMWVAEQQRLVLSDEDIVGMALQCEGPDEVDESLDDNGTTLLMAAAYRGLETTVRQCVAKQANIRRANTYGNTALHFCVAKGHRGIAGLLIDAGALADQKNNLGLTCFERVDV